MQRVKSDHIFGQQGTQMPVSVVYFKGEIFSAIFLDFLEYHSGVFIIFFFFVRKGERRKVAFLVFTIC